MSNASNLSTLANVLDDGTSGQVLTSQGSGVVAFADAASGTGVTVHNNQAAMLTDAASADEGSLHYENDNNKLYVKQSSGFFLLASITNTAPTVSDFTETTGGGSANTILDNGTFALTSGSNTVITLTATEPDLETLVYSATVTSGTASNVISSPSLPISNQSGNTFTLTPVTSGVGGTITIRFDVSDGNNVVNKTHSFSIAFKVVDSNHTTLLATAASSSGSPYSFSGLSYANKSFSFTSQDSSNNGLAFNPNGTKMYMTGSANDVIYQYSLNPAWDVSTASYDNVSLSMSGYSSGSQYSIEFKSDGSVMYISDNSQDSIDIYTVSSGSEYVLNQYSYNSTKSLSAISLITNLRSIIFKPDGSKFFALCNATNKVYEFTMSTDWDVANAQHSSSDTYDVFSAVSESSPRSAYVTPDGTQLLVSGTDNDKIHRFVLTSPWQVNSATYTSGDDFDFSGTLGTSSCVTMVASDDGTFLYLNTTNNDTVYQYNFTSNNNSTITDSSSNSHSITVTGDAYAGTFSPYRSGGYSTYFDGSSNASLQIAADSSIAIHTDFTIECWFYLDRNTNSTQAIFSCDTGTSSNGLCIQNNNGTSLILRYGGSSKLVDASNVFELDRWYHIALTYDQSTSTLTLYIDGQQYYQNTSISLSNTTTSYLTIGSLGAGFTGYSHVGYIRDFRFSSEVVYTTNFSTPTEPLANTSATEVLTCHLPYIADASTNSHSITLNSGVSTKPFSPYDYEEYSETDHGGSVYFDGTLDYLTIPASSSLDVSLSGTTIEGWFYTTSTSVKQCLWEFYSDDNNYARLFFEGGNGNVLRLTLYSSGTERLNATGTTTLSINTWYHIKVTRTHSSGAWAIYINGSVNSDASGTESASVSTATWPLDIGRDQVGLDRYWNGYISDFRIVSGTPSGSSTVPISPLSSTGAELHIKGTDASIIDKAQGSNLKLVGNTTGSTTQVKFAGSKSMYFDGTGDYITSSVVSSGNSFTAEAWIYQPVTAGSGVSSDDVFSVWNNSNGQKAFIFRIDGTSLFLFVSYDGTTNNISALSGGTINTNTWHHIALTWDGSNYRLFVDGTVVQTQASSTAPYSSTEQLQIGSSKSGASAAQEAFYQGYIQDARFTSDLARYTANFTPPSAPLEG